MHQVTRFAVAILCLLVFLGAVPLPNAIALAEVPVPHSSLEPQQGQGQQQQGQAQQGQQAQSTARRRAEQQGERPVFRVEVEVTASRVEQLLVDAPTATSIIDAATIGTSPAMNYGDLIRTLPGVNVSQMSARDITMTSRAATSTLASTQLVLVDGRSVYQDFFGFVLWDVLPVIMEELEQIEVVRGPGSAVWGANAMTGVMNVRTKSPRNLGNMTSLRAGGGEQGTGFFSVLHAGVRGDWSYKLSGGYYRQNAWPRPETINNESNTPANFYPNEGTSQPKFDVRIDRRLDDQSFLSFSGGIAGTTGIILTGIGPFSIESGSTFAYVSGQYQRGELVARFYGNFLDAKTSSLLNPLDNDFTTDTFDGSVQNTTFLAGGRHVLTYGGNLRIQLFDTTIGRGDEPRQEGGAFLQALLTAHEQVIINLGGRVDAFSILEDPVFSPRVGVTFRPSAAHDQSLRVSFNRAFRAPSLTNNFLDTVIYSGIQLGAAIPPPLWPQLGLDENGDYFFPSAAVGNEFLLQESLDQIEVGYRGLVLDDRILIDAAYYYTVTSDNIDFYPRDFYTSSDPPPAWPVSPFLLVPTGTTALPKLLTYRNIGEITNQGVEFGIRGRIDARNELFFNYTWQKTPEADGIDPAEINVPPANTFNVGVNGTYDRFLYSASVFHMGEAYWADVLDARYHGYTEASTTLNGSFGYRFANGVELSVRGTNLTNTAFQQHVFGDIIGRQVVAEIGYTLR